MLDQLTRSNTNGVAESSRSVQHSGRSDAWNLPVDPKAVEHFVASTSNIEPVNGPIYNRDVHFQLTEALAMAAGFDSIDARTIADANQYVDDDKKTTPMPDPTLQSLKDGDLVGVERRRQWHFTTPQRRAELKGKFLNSGSLEDLGKYMHVFQDLYSHRGLGPAIGQVGSKVDPSTGEPTEWSYKTDEWHGADDTFRNIGKANQMAEESFIELRNAAAYLASKGKLQTHYSAISYSEM